VEKVARSNVGLVLDTFHFFAGGSTLASIRQVDPRRIFIVHINDVERAPRRKMHDALRLYPGKGILPLRGVLRELKAIGYTGPISVEIFRPQYWARAPLRVAREARAASLTVLRNAGYA
jgi:2-keto-myo-inositol isomerase